MPSAVRTTEALVPAGFGPFMQSNRRPHRSKPSSGSCAGIMRREPRSRPGARGATDLGDALRTEPHRAAVHFFEVIRAVHRTLVGGAMRDAEHMAGLVQGHLEHAAAKRIFGLIVVGVAVTIERPDADPVALVEAFKANDGHIGVQRMTSTTGLRTSTNMPCRGWGSMFRSAASA